MPSACMLWPITHTISRQKWRASERLMCRSSLSKMLLHIHIYYGGWLLWNVVNELRCRMASSWSHSFWKCARLWRAFPMRGMAKSKAAQKVKEFIIKNVYHILGVGENNSEHAKPQSYNDRCIKSDFLSKSSPFNVHTLHTHKQT